VNVKELQGVLERLEGMYAAAGASGPAKDLRSVVRILDGYGEKSIEEFVAETRALLSAGQRHGGSAPPQPDIVEQHVHRLLSAAADLGTFEKALAAVDQDGAVTKTDWFAIANAFLNRPSGGTHTYKFKSLKEARSAIYDAFVERFEAGGKRGIIKRLTRWAS
jgi:hypothetical protein